MWRYAEIHGNSILFLCRMACSTLVVFFRKLKKMLLQFLGFLTVSKPRFLFLEQPPSNKKNIRMATWFGAWNVIHLIFTLVSSQSDWSIGFSKAFPHCFLAKKHMLEDNQTASKTNMDIDVVVMKQKLYVNITKHSEKSHPWTKPKTQTTSKQKHKLGVKKWGFVSCPSPPDLPGG